MLSILLAAAVTFRAPQIIPVPEKMEYKENVEVKLDSTTEVKVKCPDKIAAGWVADHISEWFKQKPKVCANSSDVDLANEEAYILTVKPGVITIEAKSIKGVRYAMFTLRQVAERASEGYRLKHYRMPEFTVVDSPVLKFRGIHFVWMPELSTSYIEREIRTAAQYKFNYVVIESWGVYKSERHPWFGWKARPMDKKTIAKFKAIADDLGVTLIPQLNVWGHASGARSCAGKHASLDFSPEYQPLFEPAGGAHGSVSSAWNWCLTNPEAVRIVHELVEEMHDAFGRPPFFHIGCDEADVPTCASCRATEYSKLVSNYISGICELLRKRGARAMMWHDMLIQRGDPRWKGFYANGDVETAKLPKVLPKDVVICDWYYGSDPGGTKDPNSRSSNTMTYPTLEYFSKECGFDTLTCPWEEPKGLRSQMKFARDTGLFGVLETTWHHFGGERFPRMFQMSACGAWGRGEHLSNGHFATAWRQCGWDAGNQTYKDGGWYDTQVTRDILTR
jgi:hypothetical protein